MGNRYSVVLFPFERGSDSEIHSDYWADEAELLNPSSGVAKKMMEMERLSDEKHQDLNGDLYTRRGKRGVRKRNNHLAGTILGLLIVAVLSVILGLLVGQALNNNNIGSKVPGGVEETQPPLHDWGETVTVGGQAQDVFNYISTRMSAEAIEENLK